MANTKQQKKAPGPHKGGASSHKTSSNPVAFRLKPETKKELLSLAYMLSKTQVGVITDLIHTAALQQGVSETPVTPDEE